MTRVGNRTNESATYAELAGELLDAIRTIPKGQREPSDQVLEHVRTLAGQLVERARIDGDLESALRAYYDAAYELQERFESSTLATKIFGKTRDDVIRACVERQVAAGDVKAALAITDRLREKSFHPQHDVATMLVRAELLERSTRHGEAARTLCEVAPHIGDDANDHERFVSLAVRLVACESPDPEVVRCLADRYLARRQYVEVLSLWERVPLDPVAITHAALGLRDDERALWTLRELRSALRASDEIEHARLVSRKILDLAATDCDASDAVGATWEFDSDHRDGRSGAHSTAYRVHVPGMPPGAVTLDESFLAMLGADCDPRFLWPVLDGRYRLVRLLGEDTLADEYTAEDTYARKRVTVKVLRVTGKVTWSRDRRMKATKARRQFADDALRCKEIGHRNLLAIHSVGMHSLRTYVAMDLLSSGESLATHVRFLSTGGVLELLIQICAGLAAAHERGIVHGGLSPTCILVTREGVPKIYDFGLAALRVAIEEERGDLPRLDAKTDIRAMAGLIETCFVGRQHPAGIDDVIAACDRLSAAELATRLAHVEQALEPGFAALLDQFEHNFNECGSTYDRPCSRDICFRHHPWERLGIGHRESARTTAEAFAEWASKHFKIDLKIPNPVPRGEPQFEAAAPHLAAVFRAAKGLWPSKRPSYEVYVNTIGVLAAWIAARRDEAVRIVVHETGGREVFRDSAERALLVAVFDWLSELDVSCGGLESLTLAGDRVVLRYQNGFPLATYQRKVDELVNQMRASSSDVEGRRLSRTLANLVVNHNVTAGFGSTGNGQVGVSVVDGQVEVEIRARLPQPTSTIAKAGGDGTVDS